MASLFELQRDLAARLIDPRAESDAPPPFAGDGPAIERGLAVYRANVNASAVKALSGAYPVVSQVVGAEFFEGLARAYRRAVPSTSGDLSEYGSDFAAFLAEFPHVRQLPYLPDLARLEWRVHEASGAADACAWDAATLADVAPERHEAIRFDWAPGTAIVDSAFPIARLWAIHQPDHEGAFDVDWSLAQCALVARDGLRVKVHAADAGDAAFLAAALGGARLGEAITQALEADPAFDLGGLLSRALAMNLICGFTPP